MTLRGINMRLKAIESESKGYFGANGKRIFDCVKIIKNRSTSIHVSDSSLPIDIQERVEMLVWID